MVFEREERVEAERLGEVAERQMLADDRRVGPAGLTQHVKRDPYFHRLPPDRTCPPRHYQRNLSNDLPAVPWRQPDDAGN